MRLRSMIIQRRLGAWRRVLGDKTHEVCVIGCCRQNPNVSRVNIINDIGVFGV